MRSLISLFKNFQSISDEIFLGTSNRRKLIYPVMISRMKYASILIKKLVLRTRKRNIQKHNRKAMLIHRLPEVVKIELNDKNSY